MLLKPQNHQITTPWDQSAIKKKRIVYIIINMYTIPMVTGTAAATAASTIDTVNTSNATTLQSLCDPARANSPSAGISQQRAYRVEQVPLLLAGFPRAWVPGLVQVYNKIYSMNSGPFVA